MKKQIKRRRRARAQALLSRRPGGWETILESPHRTLRVLREAYTVGFELLLNNNFLLLLQLPQFRVEICKI